MSEPTKEQIEKAKRAVQDWGGNHVLGRDALETKIADALAAETAPLHEKIASLEKQLDGARRRGYRPLAPQTGEVNEHEDLSFKLTREPAPWRDGSCRALMCPNCENDRFEVALSDNGQWNIECGFCHDAADVLTKVLAELR